MPAGVKTPAFKFKIMSKKDKKLIEDSEKNGTPIFVFSAKDKFAIRILKWYLFECFDDCSEEHIKGIEERIIEFREWQHENKSKIHIPD